MKRRKKEQNLQQSLCSGLLHLHRQFCCHSTKASGAFGSPTQEHDMKCVGYREGGGEPILKMKRHKQEQNLQQVRCSGLLHLHRRFGYTQDQVFGAFCSPTQEHGTKWVGYRKGGVAHTKNQKTQKLTELTAIPLLRAVAPTSPILLPSKSSSWSVLFFYTGTWHEMGGG